MTHPPTETQRKALYAAFSALSRESRVRTKPRPSKGRESAPKRESGASWRDREEALMLISMFCASF